MTGDQFIVSTMTWSFSRLEAFYDCPYGWKRRYIECEEGEGNFYSSYGKLCHSILEKYCKGELSESDLLTEFIERFDDEVTEPAPYNKYVDIRENYYMKGLGYFNNFKRLFGDGYKIIDAEVPVEFEVDGYPFVGYIDALVKDPDGKLIVVDHKSASMKFNRDGKPSKKSIEKINTYKQMYLYCKALMDQGMHPEIIAWNFFNDRVTYQIPFDFNEYKVALKWAVDTIHLIENETEYAHKDNFYFCRNICNVRSTCPYNQQVVKEEADDRSGFY